MRWGGMAFLVSMPAMALAAPPSFDQERPDTWDVPPSREQAERDATLVPVGKGAVFVPSMTDPAREPQYIVLREGEIVATLPPGKRAVLEPGVYEVRLGSGALADRFSRKVLVKEARTTVVPATWSTVVVSVVDERSEPFRGTYELVRLPEGTNLGIGLGADIELGEEVRSWVLEPGTYMVIKTGESFKARRDFYTFRALPGELVKLAVVMDREDGSLLGAGQVALAGTETAVKDWRLHFVVGGDAEANRRSDMVGFPSGIGFAAGVFLDFFAQYKPQRHLVFLRLKLEEGIVQVAGQPWLKDRDELKVDGLYVYRILPWLGPYLRLGYKSPVFPAFTNLDGPTTVVVEKEDGTVASLGEHSGRYTLSHPFSPIELKGGVGMSLIATASYLLDANVRVGFGGRALLNLGLREPSGAAANGILRVVTHGNSYQYGLEATAVGSLRLTRWVLATTEFDMLETVQDPKNPVISWENNVGVRLVSFLSLNYIFKLLRDVERSARLQTEHRILLRFTFQIL